MTVRPADLAALDAPGDGSGTRAGLGDGSRRRAYLHPGRMLAAAEPHVVTTILGSCVAVCLWDQRRGIGGLNHYLLPYRAANDERSGRFGNAAIRELLERLLVIGGRRRDLIAKVFGGACVMAIFREGGGDLGTKNARMAFQTLEREGIPIVGNDVGGVRGRRLIFQTDDGETRVQLL